MPDVLQYCRPRRHTNPRANKHSDFILEHILGWSAVRAVDAEFRHLLAVLERDFVHAHGIEVVVEFGLLGSGAERGGEGAGKVADLADVDGDVGVEGAGGDGEGVPLVFGDGGDVEEEPLAGFVAHAWFAELDLYGVCKDVSKGCSVVVDPMSKPTIWMADHLDDFRLSP